MARYLGSSDRFDDLLLFVVRTVETFTPAPATADRSDWIIRSVDNHYRTQHADGRLCTGHVYWHGPYSTKSGANTERNRSRRSVDPARNPYRVVTAVTLPIERVRLGEPV